MLKKILTNFPWQILTNVLKMDVMVWLDINYDQAQVQMTTLARLQHQFMAQLTVENADIEKFEDHSLKQKMEEEAMMNEGITFDPELQCWNVHYFYNDKLSNLKDNYNNVLQRIKKWDQKLKMKPELCQEVNAEIKKNIDYGFWRWPKQGWVL